MVEDTIGIRIRARALVSQFHVIGKSMRISPNRFFDVYVTEYRYHRTLL